jgi:ABC-2 type transport system permease protein
MAKATQVVYNGTDVDAAINAVTSASGAAVIVITPSYGANLTSNQSGWLHIIWIMQGTGLTESASSAPVQKVLATTTTNVSAYLIDNHVTSNSTVILHPIVYSQDTILKGRMMIGLSPDTIYAVVQSQGILVPLIMLMVIIFAGSTVITSMGMEKENKTLETLLTLPVSRRSIVMGKLVGAALVGLVVAAIYMVGMGYYMNSLTASAPIDLAKYGLTLNLFDYVLVGISLFLALICGLALCMILGIFTKNYKAAQSMTLPITLLALIPMFVTMFADFSTLPSALQVGLFAIPFTHPMLAMKELIFDNTGFVIAGIIYNAIFAAVAMFVAVTLFKKDILLTGRVKNTKSKNGLQSLFSFGKR